MFLERKLTRLLYGRHGTADYVDYYERALYNHILSSQHPEHGGLVYFTSMRPAHYRKYSQAGVAMWCCVGSGMENHFRYSEMIYAHRGADLYVNLFVPSVLDWESAGVRLRQETDFPDADTVLLTLQEGAGHFTVSLRYPAWVVAGELSLSVNDRPQTVTAAPGEYIEIERRWRPGDTLSLRLPMSTRLEQLPDGADFYAVLHGPIVLAAKTNVIDEERLEFIADDSRMGHRADGPLCPPEAQPVMTTAPGQFLASLRPVPGKAMTFTSPQLEVAGQSSVELVPFFRLHDTRYTVYWPTAAAVGALEPGARLE